MRAAPAARRMLTLPEFKPDISRWVCEYEQRRSEERQTSALSSSPSRATACSAAPAPPREGTAEGARVEEDQALGWSCDAPAPAPALAGAVDDATRARGVVFAAE